MLTDAALRNLKAALRVVCGVGTMGTVLHIVAPRPFLCGAPSDVEHSGRFPGRQTGILDLLADFRCGSGLRVDTCTHAASRP